jgi:para-aminobenzoate synthetase component 1
LQRITDSFYVEKIDEFKQRMLNWVDRFGICCFMDSHDYADKYHRYDCIAAAGAYKFYSEDIDVLSKLNNFCNEHKNEWIFGHLGYDIKNEIDNLQSTHTNKIGFPNVYFFIPEIVLCLNDHTLIIHSIRKNPAEIFAAINTRSINNSNISSQKNINLSAALTENEYIEIVSKLQQHILRGDCYEINYCQEFFAENVHVDILSTYLKLLAISPTPFSCFYKLDNKYLLCASPERFLSKINQQIFSQPIKGTAARSKNPNADNIEKTQLYNNEKEKSENVMIVDLVRNDLSKVCEPSTVKVEELFGIYSFAQVHQMISTVSGMLKENISFTDIIKATFPMGSMTGAPKRRAMQLIEQYEKTKRQLFSGSVGYISPENNFDFNVVIRSIFYNADNRYLNFLVGSAITFYADAAKEYEECLLKAKAMREALQ